MRLERRSKTLLAITKAKAKMYEFGVDEAEHINLPQDPRELLTVTIGILGELAAIESRGRPDQAEQIGDLNTQLVSIGQYFDALDHSHIADNISVYLKLAGSASYYLSDMLGSSSVLARSLPDQVNKLTPSRIELLLGWLLKGNVDQVLPIFDKHPFSEFFDNFTNIFIGYFHQSHNGIDVSSAAHALRETVYASGSDRELLFVDVIVALAKRKIDNSSRNCLPLHTGLPIEKWLPVLNKEGFVREFWPAQKLLGKKGVFAGVSAVVQMPTSAGKTKSVELIIRSAFLSDRANLAVVVAPFRALCREISLSFQYTFNGEDITINELQDITQISAAEVGLIRSLIDNNSSPNTNNRSIIVSTPEKLAYLLRHEPDLATKVGLLVFDEGHQFDDDSRGVTYELLLASLKEAVRPDVQKVLISAVMSNAESIGQWLNGEAGVEIEGSKCLPTIRSVAFASWTTRVGQLRYIDQDGEQERDYFVPRIIEQINLGTEGQERVDRLFPDHRVVPSIAAYLGLRLCHQGPVAIFCGAKTTVTSISELLVEAFRRGLQFNPPKSNSDVAELSKIAKLASLHFGEDHIFCQAIQLGILPHSANIPNGLRISVESAMLHNQACLVICTSTLAQGVNLPIRYLIVSSTFQAGQEISTRDFHNLIGRAGRAGLHTEGSIIFADPKIYDQRNQHYSNWRWSRANHLLDFSNAEDCVSSLKRLIEPIRLGEETADAIEFIVDPKAVRNRLLNHADDNGLDIRDALNEIAYKESLIQTIESYLLAHLKDNPNAGQPYFIDLAKGTLAYSLSDEEEKPLLISAFEHISEHVFSVGVEKFSYYGRALLGLQQLSDIETWVDENIDDLQLAESPEHLLTNFWPILCELTRNRTTQKIFPKETLLGFAQHWISGSSYVELHRLLTEQGAYYQANTQRRAIKLDNVIELADSGLSFDMMLYVGALADVLEGRNFSEELVSCARTLQNRLKLGLASKLQIWLYTKGFADREVCKLLASALLDTGVPEGGFDFDVITQNISIIQDALSELPSHFLLSMAD